MVVIVKLPIVPKAEVPKAEAIRKWARAAQQFIYQTMQRPPSSATLSCT